MVEIDEHPEPVWCVHGLEWTWDREAQQHINPHEGGPNASGAFPDECSPLYASHEAWQLHQDMGVIES